jgi:flagellum-specific peptidoglycan hydrolase FlgJ
MNTAMVQDYVGRFSKIAITEMEKFGVPASISLAQGLIESRAGHSKLAQRNNNHFGIKCFSRRCKKGHCSNFTDDTHKDFLRVFKNPWESWREHSKMISTGRYAKLKKHGRDYRKWAYGLKSAGYATDRTYADKLIGIIERYQLYKHDR